MTSLIKTHEAVAYKCYCHKLLLLNCDLLLFILVFVLCKRFTVRSMGWLLASYALSFANIDCCMLQSIPYSYSRCHQRLVEGDSTFMGVNLIIWRCAVPYKVHGGRWEWQAIYLSHPRSIYGGCLRVLFKGPANTCLFCWGWNWQPSDLKCLAL